jgi:uncharacterized Tic20 family protein
MGNTKPTQDERIMAALAHGSVVVFGMGIIAAVVVWATQKDDSHYVAFQALQAAVYQILGFAVFMVGMCCWMALYFVSFIPLMVAVEQGSSEPPALFILSLFLMLVPFAFMGLWILGGIWGAVRTLQGREFSYLLLGDWLQRRLSSQ